MSRSHAELCSRYADTQRALALLKKPVAVRSQRKGKAVSKCKSKNNILPCVIESDAVVTEPALTDEEQDNKVSEHERKDEAQGKTQLGRDDARVAEEANSKGAEDADKTANCGFCLQCVSLCLFSGLGQGLILISTILKDSCAIRTIH